jgi:hypothetical protein
MQSSVAGPIFVTSARRAHSYLLAVLGLEKSALGDELETATRYRGRAEGLRSIAEQKELSQSRTTLLNIAIVYERLAAELEAIHATNERLSRLDQKR